MHNPKKLAAVAASIAVMVPVGIAQATHDSGKMGAPGQVCKPLKQEQRSDLREFKNQDPRPSRQEIKDFRKEQRALYKGCIQGAADARSHDEGGENGEVGTENNSDRSEGAPGQACKSLQRARRDQMREFRRQDPRPSKAERKAFRQTLHAAYRGCIEAAAEARSDEDPENEGETTA